MKAVAIGKFDGFHKGHQVLLNKLIEETNMTAAVCKIDFPGPGLLTAKEQKEFLEEFGIRKLTRLPFTEEFAAMSPETFVQTILCEKMDAGLVVVGTDFRFGYQRKGTVDLLKSMGNHFGFRVHAVEKLEMDGSPVSSTRIRAAYEEGNVQEAEKLLGYPVTFRGTVVRGKQLGRTIGFPTANLIADPDKFLPRYGVYTASVETPAGVFPGITNIGERPTVEDGSGVTIESFLPGFSGDLYEKTIKVRLTGFIRPEMRFESVEQLKEQMKRDLQISDLT